MFISISIRSLTWYWISVRHRKFRLCRGTTSLVLPMMFYEIYLTGVMKFCPHQVVWRMACSLLWDFPVWFHNQGRWASDNKTSHCRAVSHQLGRAFDLQLTDQGVQQSDCGRGVTLEMINPHPRNEGFREELTREDRQTELGFHRSSSRKHKSFSSFSFGSVSAATQTTTSTSTTTSLPSPSTAHMFLSYASTRSRRDSVAASSSSNKGPASSISGSQRGGSSHQRGAGSSQSGSRQSRSRRSSSSTKGKSSRGLRRKSSVPHVFLPYTGGKKEKRGLPEPEHDRSSSPPFQELDDRIPASSLDSLDAFEDQCFEKVRSEIHIPTSRAKSFAAGFRKAAETSMSKRPKALKGELSLFTDYLRDALLTVESRDDKETRMSTVRKQDAGCGSSEGRTMKDKLRCKDREILFLRNVLKEILLPFQKEETEVFAPIETKAVPVNNDEVKNFNNSGNTNMDMDLLMNMKSKINQSNSNSKKEMEEDAAIPMIRYPEIEIVVDDISVQMSQITSSEVGYLPPPLMHQQQSMLQPSPLMQPIMQPPLPPYMQPQAMQPLHFQVGSLPLGVGDIANKPVSHVPYGTTPPPLLDQPLPPVPFSGNQQVTYVPSPPSSSPLPSPPGYPSKPTMATGSPTFDPYGSGVDMVPVVEMNNNRYSPIRKDTVVNGLVIPPLPKAKEGPSYTDMVRGEVRNGRARGMRFELNLVTWGVRLRGTYNGPVKDGVPHGNGVLRFENRDLYIGHFQNGALHGEGTFFGRSQKSRLTTLRGIFSNNEYVGKSAPAMSAGEI